MVGFAVPHRRRRPTAWAIDILISAIVVSWLFLPLPARFGTATTLGVIVTALPAALLWLRRSWPIPTLLGCVGCFSVAVFTAPLTPAAIIPTAIAVYAHAVTTTRRRGFIVGIATLAATVSVSAVAVGGQLLDPMVGQVAVSICFAVALGDSIRNRRDYITEITARAEHAEATRESEAARRVTEERLRIARDLHDVVAHQITVISLQAGVASSVLETRPEEARSALATVRAASRRTLTEIGDLLTMLRNTDEAPESPQPRLGQVTDLVDEFGRAGLRVTVHHEGPVPELSPGTEVVAFRILQEALTNALRHSTDRHAHVLLAGQPTHLTLIVTNQSAAATRGASDGTAGHGLDGIRERVASVRGQSTITDVGGVFRLEVTLPAQQEQS